MKKILFVVRRAVRCGIADYGKRVFDILKKSSNFEFIWCEIDDEREFFENFNTHKPDVIIFNYYHSIMGFINNNTISKLGGTPNILIHHEGGFTFSPNCIIDIDYMLPERPHENFYTSTRPIFEDIKLEDNFKEDVTSIGTFGFGFKNKQLPKIAELVCQQFENAKLKINVPFAMFGDNEGNSAKTEINKVKEVILRTNKNIELIVNHKFLNHNELLNFLHKNDINIFLYGNEENQHGLSSSIDYALSVKKPIGVSSSSMYKHINSIKPSINLENTSIKEIIKNGFDPLEEIYNLNSNKNLLEKYEFIIKKLLN
jgi:hypothetical protein